MLLIVSKFLVHERSLPNQYPKMCLKQVYKYVLFQGMWDWSETVFNIESKGWVRFHSSPLVAFSLFRVLSIYVIDWYNRGFEKTIASQVVKMFKQTLDHIVYYSNLSLRMWFKDIHACLKPFFVTINSRSSYFI